VTIAADFIARLQAITPPIFAIVEGAADFSTIDGVPTGMPAAYVLVEEEESGDNERATGPVLQRCEADIAVVIVTDNVSDVSGGAVASDVETLKAAVRAALIGFVPASAQGGDPITHIGGKLISARRGTVWHRELFAAAYYIEEQ